MSFEKQTCAEPAARLKHVAEFDGLRAFLALWVVFGHVATSVALSTAPLPQNLGNTSAVDVFIILSGFVIAFLRWNVAENYGVYIMRRFLRLFPAYLVFLILSVLLLDVTESVLRLGPVTSMTESRLSFLDAAHENFAAHLAAHLFLLQGLLPSAILPQSAYTLIGQAWSVSMEWQFYLIAPFLLSLLAFSPVKVSRLVAFGVVCVMLSFLHWAGFVGSKIFSFAIGMLSFYAWKKMLALPKLSPLLIKSVALSISGVLVAISSRYLGVALWVSVFAFVCLAQRTTDKPALLVRDVLRSAPVQWLGIRSYSLYLCHMIALNLCAFGLVSYGIKDGVYAACLLLGTVALSLLMAGVCYRYVEKPAINLGRVWAARYREAKVTGAADNAG